MSVTRMLIGGEWRDAGSGRTEDITSPYDGSVVGTVPRAGQDDVEAAITAAEAGAVTWRRTPAHERMRILLRAARSVDERAAEIAKTITAENGKAITEATAEANRAGETIRLAAFEGAQLYGDSLPLDAHPGTGVDKVGFTVRQPCGIVLAITPFNYPALLVLHKVAPALAAGNAVVLKPAETTPLTALALAACFIGAGLPGNVLSVLTGHGSEIGDQLVSDPRIRKISFTGSTQVGDRIARHAGVKKISLELGASCAVIIMPDSDLGMASDAVAAGGYANAGQVCNSVQRIITHHAVNADFLDALLPKVKAIRTGDPSSRGSRRRRRCRPVVAVQQAGAVRPGGGGQHREELGRGYSPGQRHQLRPVGRRFHLRRCRCGTRDPRNRLRQRAHQLDAVVAGRPHALWRPQGQRHRQGRTPPGRVRDDGGEDHCAARPPLVTPRAHEGLR